MRTKKQILKESSIDSQYNTQLILEVLLDIRDLSVLVEPSKPSEEVTFGEQIDEGGTTILKVSPKLETEIRADERARCRVIVKKYMETPGLYDTNQLLNLLK